MSGNNNFSQQMQPQEYPPMDNYGGAGDPPEQAAPVSLIQCPTCERKFNEKAYEKHAKICVKVF